MGRDLAYHHHLILKQDRWLAHIVDPRDAYMYRSCRSCSAKKKKQDKCYKIQCFRLKVQVGDIFSDTGICDLSLEKCRVRPTPPYQVTRHPLTLYYYDIVHSGSWPNPYGFVFGLHPKSLIPIKLCGCLYLQTYLYSFVSQNLDQFIITCSAWIRGFDMHQNGQELSFDSCFYSMAFAQECYNNCTLIYKILIKACCTLIRQSKVTSHLLLLALCKIIVKQDYYF